MEPANWRTGFGSELACLQKLQGQQAAVVAAPGPPCPSDVVGSSTPSRFVESLRCRAKATDGSGVRNLCDKYSAICGFKLHPHLLRHTMAHQFLADNQNDLVSLAQILGHKNLNTTARYTKQTQDQLGEASDRLSY